MLGLLTCSARDLNVHIGKFVGDLGVPPCESIVQSDRKVGSVCRIISRHFDGPLKTGNYR